MIEKLFHLECDYEPAGDQPQAIRELVEGIEAGLARQTLLGVTGSGKSIGRDEPLYIERYENGRLVSQIVPAGAFIDGLLDAHGLGAQDGETEQLACADGTYFTHAYDPATGEAGRFPVAALIRHRAPERMFRVTTACGRRVVLTGDHNLWVLRDGVLTLLKTEDVRKGDHLPVPDAIEASADLRTLDVSAYLADSGLSVLAEEGVRERAASGGGEYRRAAQAHISVRSDHGECPLPAQWPLSDALLTLLGGYIADGDVRQPRLLPAGGDPASSARVEAVLRELGLPGAVEDRTRLLASQALVALLARLCGRHAAEKRLPDFWPRLSDRSLGLLLRAWFDGAGTVTTRGDVIGTTESDGLASDLAYALKRFGIHARLRRARDDRIEVVIAGAKDIARYARSIGFESPDKLARLETAAGRTGDATADLVPIDAAALLRLRRGLGLSARRLAALAGCSRPALAAIESGRRRPGRALMGRLLDALEEQVRARAVADLGLYA